MQPPSAEQAGPAAPNPLLALRFETAIEAFGPEYWDRVEAAAFPRTTLRFRNNALLSQLGLDALAVSDRDLEQAFGASRPAPPCWRCVTTATSSTPTTPSWAMAAVSSTASCAIATANCRTWAARAAAPPPGAAAVTAASPSRAACGR